MAKIHRSVLKLHIYTANVGLCLILFLRGILYTGWFHPGDRLILPQDSPLEDTLSRVTDQKTKQRAAAEKKKSAQSSVFL